VNPPDLSRPFIGYRPRVPLRAAGGIVVLGLISLLSSCIHNPPHVGGKPSAPTAPNRFWTPPKQAITRDSVPQTPVPPDIAPRLAHLTLPDVVDVALINNPLTRESYAQARAAGATIGAAYGAYLPQITVSGFGTREGSTAGTSATTSGGVVSGGGYHTLEQATGSVSWLLFSFGELAGFSYAKEAAFAASFNHNATVQTTILGVEQAYFNYNAAKAIARGDSESVREDSANLAAAQARHQVGVATNSDVLQAQTTLSQAELTLETDVGSVETTRGTLAVAMGLPATTAYDITAEPPNVPIQGVADKVDSLVERAVHSRPDLAAYRAQARQAEAEVGIVRGEGLPTLTFGASGTRTDRVVQPFNQCCGNTYSAQIGISIPLFQGFTNAYNVFQAQELAKASAANAEYQRDVVINQVFTSYYTLKTSTVRVKSTDDLMASAQASYDLALGQYKQGVGSILTVLTAQAALDSARSQEASARWTWYSSLAQLSHDVGVIGIHGEPNLTLGDSTAGSGPR
jgi:outer membrane protein